MTDIDPPRFDAPFRELIHNISKFGEHWSWRCGVNYSRLSPGYVDGACRYDHVADSWEQLVQDATEHMAHWHDTHPAPEDEDEDADERKIECPDCVQWSMYGPDAEEKLIEHWARIHMRRVSWGGDGTAMIWATPADRAPQDSGGTS